MDGPSLNLVVIRAADPERSVSFYERLGLSFQKHRHGNGPEDHASELGSAVFEIYPRADGKNDSTSAIRLGFRVPSVDDALARLRETGVTIVSPAKDSPWGRRAVVDDV